MSHQPATGWPRWRILPPQSPVLEVDATSSELSLRSVTQCRTQRALHGSSPNRRDPWEGERNGRLGTHLLLAVAVGGELAAAVGC